MPTLRPDDAHQRTDRRVCKVFGGLVCFRGSNDERASREQQQYGYDLQKRTAGNRGALTCSLLTGG